MGIQQKGQMPLLLKDFKQVLRYLGKN